MDDETATTDFSFSTSPVAETTEDTSRGGRRCSVCGETGHNARKHDTATVAVRPSGESYTPPRGNMRERVREWIRSPDEPVTERVAKGKVGELTENVTAPLIALVMLTLPMQLRATEDEVNAIAAPLTRLLYRHVKLFRKLSADAADILALVTAVAIYVTRVSNQQRHPRVVVRNEPAAPPAESVNGQVDAMTPEVAYLYR